MQTLDQHGTAAKSWLPPVGSWRYHLLLSAVALLILGPLGGITAAYMNFSLGFFVGGQVLAGILGSAVTFGYGAEGKHGANYMQTMAASVASMAALGVLVQAMVWLGLPQPPAWQLVLYFACIGMFGVGVGMLYTPVLVDRMNLTFPSGYAVANILRALTDRRLLRSSIGKLGAGTGLGYAAGLGASFVKTIEASGWSSSTLGAGMVVGARIAIPGLVVGLLGRALEPYLVSIGWLDAGAPFRKIGFIIALGGILGAAIVDMALILGEAVRKLGQPRAPAAEVDAWKRTDVGRLGAWVGFWALAVVLVGTGVLGLPAKFVLTAIVLVFVFLMINGISLGISDSNPISSAFVLTVFLMAAIGLEDAGTGLMCASILLVSTSIGGDMQQDRSTGARLGTDRTIQFRYQVIGVLVGAVLAVVLARLFMAAYPVLTVDQYAHPDTPGAEKWQSAMTFKFVGALQGLTHPKAYITTALVLGVGIGLVTEVLRKLLKRSDGWRRFVASGRVGYWTDFTVDAVLLPSPYASSFGGFVEFATTAWFALGGVLPEVVAWTRDRLAPAPTSLPLEGEVVPEDMSTTSLIGGGLIAGDSLAALSLGIWGLLSTLG
jgi:uncharacterized oligopeptide transporter (OPT) family protein